MCPLSCELGEASIRLPDQELTGRAPSPLLLSSPAEPAAVVAVEEGAAVGVVADSTPSRAATDPRILHKGHRGRTDGRGTLGVSLSSRSAAYGVPALTADPRRLSSPTDRPWLATHGRSASPTRRVAVVLARFGVRGPERGAASPCSPARRRQGAPPLFVRLTLHTVGRCRRASRPLDPPGPCLPPSPCLEHSAERVGKDSERSSIGPASRNRCAMDLAPDHPVRQPMLHRASWPIDVLRARLAQPADATLR